MPRAARLSGGFLSEGCPLRSMSPEAGERGSSPVPRVPGDEYSEDRGDSFVDVAGFKQESETF